MPAKAFELKIEGLIQGVGFRPFVYTIAQRERIAGSVRNTNSGVSIYVQAEEKNIKCFMEALSSELPAAAYIHKIRIEEKLLQDLNGFKILSSEDSGNETTQVCPDIAVCDECLNDIKTQEYRINYPFTNCTHCGPRFTILKDLPYDRCNTSMDVFQMCPSCSSEYSEIENRRFHAQPVACNNCGPKYTLQIKDREIIELEEILKHISEIIERGGIIAIKGLGGFFLLCDASNEIAVLKLRKSKIRESKPFAVLFRDIEAAKRFTNPMPGEENLLNSWQRPIVILNAFKSLAPSVSMGFDTIGAMLPYMPIHYMIFDSIQVDALVLTSGNLSDEPILIDNSIAAGVLGPITDAILHYNRDIVNRVDDSVAIVVNESPRLIRRSRGYAPAPIFLERSVDGILATGAELNNCFCIGKEKQAILSQHIGDLKNFETYEFFKESIRKYTSLFRLKTSCIAHDLHPDYLSSSYAREIQIKSYGIQHHHAHIASCMAEHGLDEKVIGVAFDGTGYGTDGTIWGSEFLIADLMNFERLVHFPYIALPGGDSVTHEPWRTGLSVLHGFYGNHISALDLPFIADMDPGKMQIIIQAIQKNINSPLSCSAGRWFDAIAAISGICWNAGFHSEAPMRLEAGIDPEEKGEYPWEMESSSEIGLKPLISSIIHDIHNKVAVSKISTRFHNMMAAIIIAQVKSISKSTGIFKVVLSGGTFQNKFLLTKLENELRNSKIKLFTPGKIPCNDAGIALGQLVIAAKRREDKK